MFLVFFPAHEASPDMAMQHACQMVGHNRRPGFLNQHPPSDITEPDARVNGAIDSGNSAKP